MKKLLSIILTILTINSAVAGDVTYLKAGDKAPVEGFLFTKDKEAQVRARLIEADSFKLVNESLNKSLDLEISNTGRETEKLNLCLDQNDKIAHNLNSERQMSTLEKLGWFTLGVIGTGVAFMGVKKLSQ